MKNKYIDIKNYIKNNRAIFYWVILLTIGAVYFSLFAYSILKPETASREGAVSGEAINLDSKELTYLNSYYNEALNELEVHFGINSVQSLFSEDNLEAKIISQTDLNNEYEATVKKETPQLITMKFSDVPEDYLIAKLTMKYQQQGSDESQTVDLYVNHNEVIDKSFATNDYKNISIEFKSSFLVAEIDKLKNTETELNDYKSSIESNIETLQGEESLLTESEKESIKTQIDSMETQLDTTNKNIENIQKEISERQKQKKEIESVMKD